MIITIREDEHKVERIAPGADWLFFFFPPPPVMLMSASELYKSRQGSMENADDYGCTLDRLRWLLIQNDYAVCSFVLD